MKKLFFVVMVLAGFIQAFGQAKKPTIMIIPADIYCNRAGYTKTFDNQGNKTVVSDYTKMFQNDENIRLVISKISGMMADRGFPLKDLEAELKNIAQEQAEDNMTTSSTSGSSIDETPLDAILRTAKADIIMDIDFSVTKNGPNKSIKFTLNGLDAYTSKNIASAAGVGKPSASADAAVLMEEAVLVHLDNFNARLMAHFEDLFANGREVRIYIKTFASWGKTLEEEYGDKELKEIISDWMAAATVKGRFTTLQSTDKILKFEQVRIPLYDEKGKAIDAEAFIRPLSKILKKEPYSIVNKVMPKGLGLAQLVLGEK